MKIYLAHPISGLDYDSVMKYYTEVGDRLEDCGYTVLCPMVCKGYLADQKVFKPTGYTNPVSTDHAIFNRDSWMVRDTDVVLCDFTNSTTVSIGCVMELAWASLLGKHVVVVMDKNNPHWHAFVREAADIVFDLKEDALDYLERLALGIP
jgi:nucleoside 2-deoxyribosyltransferase